MSFRSSPGRKRLGRCLQPYIDASQAACECMHDRCVHADIVQVTVTTVISY